MIDQLDEDQLRAMSFFESIPKEGILTWLRDTEIGRTTLKTLGHALGRRGDRSADSEA